MTRVKGQKLVITEEMLRKFVLNNAARHVMQCCDVMHCMKCSAYCCCCSEIWLKIKIQPKTRVNV
jgi:hypothetical protein